MIDLAIDGVSAAATRIFTAAGAPGDMAAQLTAWLVNSNLSGHPSHGLQRVTEYVRQIQEGHMDPAARPRVHLETETTVVLDGQQGLGHFAADRLTRELAGKCRQVAASRWAGSSTAATSDAWANGVNWPPTWVC